MPLRLITEIFIQIGKVNVQQVKLENYFNRKNERLKAVKQMYIDELNEREKMKK